MGDYQDLKAEEKRIRANETEYMTACRELDEAIKRRVVAGNKVAVDTLKRLMVWRPECGFRSNIRPAYADIGSDPKTEDDIKEYKKANFLNEAPFCSEAYTYEVWGKEDARTFLAYLGQIARALGLDGLHDSRPR